MSNLISEFYVPITLFFEGSDLIVVFQLVLCFFHACLGCVDECCGCVYWDMSHIEIPTVCQLFLHAVHVVPVCREKVFLTVQKKFSDLWEGVIYASTVLVRCNQSINHSFKKKYFVAISMEWWYRVWLQWIYKPKYTRRQPRQSHFIRKVLDCILKFPVVFPDFAHTVCNARQRAVQCEHTPQNIWHVEMRDFFLHNH